jgi:hypothetical protein
MVEECVFQIVLGTDDEDGTTCWFWTHQSPDDDEAIDADRLIGPFDTEEQARDNAIATLSGSGSIH